MLEFAIQSDIGHIADEMHKAVLLVAGLGLDSQLSWRVSVTPVVTMYSGSLGTLRDPRSRASRAYLWNQRIVAFGLAITAQDRRPGWKKV